MISYRLLLELQSVLMREKFRHYRPERETLDYVVWLREKGSLYREGEIASLSPDPEDDYLLALAQVSGAGYLVSGDGDLGGLQAEELGIKVLSPREFYELLMEGGTGEDP